MIELKVEDYCHECTEFEAETRKGFLTADGTIVAVECVVVCKNRQQCRYIKRFLEGQICK